MWKWILCTILCLSTSCFAHSPFAESSEQAIYHELFVDHELENLPEDTVVIEAEQLEDIIEDLNRAKESTRRTKIWFVNNTNPLPGNGSYKNPFNQLILAQQASKKGDIIFVFPGDNTTTGMDQGFVMKTGQRLLGAGVHHKINFPQRKLVVRAASTTLPYITNTNGSVIVLANSCEVSGINIVNIRNGDGIIGGDPNPAGPTRLGIKNTLIRKNVIGGSGNTVVHGAIYLPNCRGHLVIEHNYILDVLSSVAANGRGVSVFNQVRPVSSHVIIKKNILSNLGSSGIYLNHSSPSGKVKALIEDNIVFNIGQTGGDGILIGALETSAGGKLCVKVIRNFCQNVNDGFNLSIRAFGSSRVKAIVEENLLARSAAGEIPTNFGFSATAADSSRLCLKLVKNSSEFGYVLNQSGNSRFRLEPVHKNLGLPFTVNGNVIFVKSHKCNCEHPSSSHSSSSESSHSIGLILDGSD